VIKDRKELLVLQDQLAHKDHLEQDHKELKDRKEKSVLQDHKEVAVLLDLLDQLELKELLVLQDHKEVVEALVPKDRKEKLAEVEVATHLMPEQTTTLI
jgi:hypothetical protein